jgi:signal transduction histidine kinase
MNGSRGIVPLGLAVKAKPGRPPCGWRIMTTNPADTDATSCDTQLRESLLAGYQMALGHELPNAFVGIQGLARLLLADQAERLDPNGKELLLRLADLARQTDRLVRAVAEIGRLVRAPGPAEPVPLDEAVSEMVAEIKLLFDPNVVEYIIQDPMPTVIAPRRALYLVLQHLLRNATRAVQGKAGARVEVGARPTPDGLELWIADNGCGLSATQQLHVFEAFRGDPSWGGQGLGLFLVGQVVAAWHGCVRVHSEPGKGATFTVRIP